MAKGIVYQNKDIEFKILSEYYREKSFRAYGLQLGIDGKQLELNCFKKSVGPSYFPKQKFN